MVSSRLAALNMGVKLSRTEGLRQLRDVQDQLLHLRLALAGLLENPALGLPVCVLFEGWDASGKGGAIKRLVEPLDPRHVRVATFGPPSEEEKRHHFLWRFWKVLPGWGGMTVLDRSWYGRILVERVDGLTSAAQWERAFGEIVEFEKALANEDTILVKIWLHITADEQLKRFQSRDADPLRRWKLTPEDWRNRDLRAEYEVAVEDMLRCTDHPAAPWILIEGNNKAWARVKVIRTVVAAIEKGMAEHGLPICEFPKR